MAKDKKHAKSGEDAKSDGKGGADGAGASDESSGGGIKRILLSVVMVVGLAGGGYLLGARTSASAETTQIQGYITAEGTCVCDLAGAEIDEESEEDEDELTEVVDLEAMSINLADGHFLRVAVSLGLGGHGEEGGDGGGHGKKEETSDEPSIPVAPARDIVLATLSGRTFEELQDPQGREAVRTHLSEKIIEEYGEQVVAVYFTEFVMQ